jgi:hypothetical protein
LRSKDPEYIGDDEESQSAEASGQDQESSDQILGNNNRVLSPELLNQRNRQAGSTSNNGTSQERGNFQHLSQKNSYSHTSHHAAMEPSRRSENNYHMQNNVNNVKSQQAQQHPSNIIHAGGSSLPSQTGKMNSS